MNKPIRCTTHFHACDCREYEFEKLREENGELKNKLDNKRVYIKQLKDKNLSLVGLIDPMSRRLDEKDAEIERLEKEVINRNQYKLNQEGLDKAHTIYEGEIKKLQHQLEIQTKRVENLSEGLKRAKQDIVFLKKFADCPYPERYRCRCEYCEDRKHMQAESELNSCQAIDQELEKQLEGVNGNYTRE